MAPVPTQEEAPWQAPRLRHRTSQDQQRASVGAQRKCQSGESSNLHWVPRVLEPLHEYHRREGAAGVPKANDGGDVGGDDEHAGARV